MSTLATRKQSRAIRNQMRAVRCELPYAMDDARDELKQLADWKYYVRKFPMTAMTCTAAAAYLAVPQKPTRRGSTDDQADDVPKSSVIGSLIGAATAMAVRSGTSLLMRQLGSTFSQGHNTATADNRSSQYQGRTQR